MNDASPAISVERLHTPRLLLRELRSDDFEAYADHMANPDATAYMAGILDRRRAWSAFASLTGAWMLTGAGWWAVELRATGEFVGTVGGFFRETSLPPGPASDLELGWNLLQRFWRNGYASEAARAALAFGFARHPVRRAIAHIEEMNHASIGVARAIGMTLEGEVDFYGVKLLRYVVDRPTTPTSSSSSSSR